MMFKKQTRIKINALGLLKIKIKVNFKYLNSTQISKVWIVHRFMKIVKLKKTYWEWNKISLLFREINNSKIMDYINKVLLAIKIKIILQKKINKLR